MHLAFFIHKEKIKIKQIDAFHWSQGMKMQCVFVNKSTIQNGYAVILSRVF